MYPKRWNTVDENEFEEDEVDDSEFLNFDTSGFFRQDRGSSSQDTSGESSTKVIDYKRVRPSFSTVPPKSNREIENEQRVRIYNQSKDYLTPERIVWLRSRAQDNLNRHETTALPSSLPLSIFVVAEDTLNAAQTLTATYGERFGVLNMANAFTIGGGYLKGASAQEENLFRRTTIPLEIEETHRRPDNPKRYTTALSNLIEANAGFVYIPAIPSVCFRSSELHSKGNVQGYNFLPNDQIFDFWEIRSSAVDVKRLGANPTSYSVVNSMRLRIRSQLMTLIDRNIRYVVLSAFGCGAFGNDAETIATLYAQELRLLMPHFRVVAFAIFYAGLNRENYDIFKRVMTTYFGNTVPVYDSFSATTAENDDVTGAMLD
jgi:hypothetical protein